MTTITADNIDAIREQIAGDQARELEVGCKTWNIAYRGSCSGNFTVWPNGRGAVEFGGDSVWGDWCDKYQILYTDESDSDGLPVNFDVDGRRTTLAAQKRRVASLARKTKSAEAAFAASDSMSRLEAK